MRVVRLDGLRLVATELGANSIMVRVHRKDGPDYEQATVITPSDDGRTLYQSGWIGPPLTPAEWLAAREALFPLAERVEFERMRADGTMQHRVIRLPRSRRASFAARLQHWSEIVRSAFQRPGD